MLSSQKHMLASKKAYICVRFNLRIHVRGLVLVHESVCNFTPTHVGVVIGMICVSQFTQTDLRVHLAYYKGHATSYANWVDVIKDGIIVRTAEVRVTLAYNSTHNVVVISENLRSEGMFRKYLVWLSELSGVKTVADEIMSDLMIGILWTHIFTFTDQLRRSGSFTHDTHIHTSHTSINVTTIWRVKLYWKHRIQK